MALDSRFIIAPSLEMYFVDKDTGLPLSNGIVTFYKDNDRTVLKPVYTLNGNPPYDTNSFVELPNPVRLSAYGTFMDDNGNDVLPYYFPYEGTPDQNNSTVELYYITVESEGNIEQFVREAWPANVSSGGNINTTNDVYNFIPNGQFLAHNDISASSSGTPDGIITQDVTPIAQGGWEFVRTPGTSSVNEVKFIQETSFQDTQPTSNPRYAVELICTTVDSLDTVKDLRIKFPDVNKFGSSDTSVLYTFSVTARSDSPSPVSLNVYLIKNYGTGGDTETEELIGNISLTGNYTIQNNAFSFGTNDGKTIGSLNDDYVEIAIRLPLNQSFDISMTDFILATGDLDIIGFPVQTNADMLTRSVAGWMDVPAYNGNDLHLPLVLTKEGLTFDACDIGNIVAKTDIKDFDGAISTIGNELLATGETYKTTDYSPLGIPYSRLQSKLWDPTQFAPKYGTGPDFVNTYINTTVNSAIRIATNVGAPSAGASDVSSNITFSNIHTGADYGVSGYLYGTTDVVVIGNDFASNSSGANAGTSGFTITILRSNTAAPTKQIFEITGILSASSLATGGVAKYFNFWNPSGTHYYMWFQVTNETDPAPGGTGIMVKLTSTDNAAEVAKIIRESISGFTVTKGVVPAASSIAAGSYFNFSSPLTNYIGWFKKSGMGSNPNIPGRVSVQININSGDSSSDVATAIRLAMNQAYFATPNIKGQFLRGVDITEFNNYDPGPHYSLLSTLSPDLTGTFEYDMFSSHDHPGSTTGPNHGDRGCASGSGVSAWSDNTGTHSLVIAFDGSFETRPVSAGVVWAIKY